MMNKPPLPYTKGMRLGNMPQIRTILDEELESVWTGKQTPQAALDNAVKRVMSCCVVSSNRINNPFCRPAPAGLFHQVRERYVSISPGVS